MIPTIEQILEDYRNGIIDLSQASAWITEHIDNSDLRDMFASHILQGMITTFAQPYSGGDINLDKHCAKGAYKMADAMLEARKQ